MKKKKKEESREKQADTDRISRMMDDMLLERVWRIAGKRPFQCSEFNYREYKEGYLPGKCAECWKVCISRFYDIDLLKEFLDTLSPERFLCKFNSGVAVFYWDTREQAEEFLSEMQAHIDKKDWKGEIQRACKTYRDARPEWWKDNVTFVPKTNE